METAVLLLKQLADKQKARAAAKQAAIFKAVQDHIAQVC